MEWDRKKVYVILLRSGGSNTLSLSYIARYAEHSYTGVKSLYFNGEFLMIIDCGIVDIDRFTWELGGLLKRQGAYCGISYECSDILKLSQYYNQARISADFGDHESGSVNRCQDYALEYIYGRMRDTLNTDILSPVPDILEAYDRNNGTDYYNTLVYYLLFERDQSRTAKKLCIHRNSLAYRIRKIEELTGVCLDNPKMRIYIILTYAMKGGESHIRKDADFK